ncbi:MAG TPA: ThuA domain-containing protein [Methylomirabilota bacterium]|nr:ThuA domain-containing protein [Methylomirabilota bacterium]
MGIYRLVAVLFSLVCATTLHAANPPTIVLVSGEDEYHSTQTLPVFARFLETNYGFKTIYLERKPKPDSIAGLDALDRADLLILFARRMTLPADQLARFQKYFDSGKPTIGIRTASHAFQNWLIFDKRVLGGNYQNHYGNDALPSMQVNPAAQEHPIMRGVPGTFSSAGSLYRNTPLQTNTTLLLTGTIPDHTEPVAWTHDYKGARVFYTSLGHPKDFEDAAFRRLLANAIHWALNNPVPRGE